MQLELDGKIGTVIEFQGEDVLVAIANRIERWGVAFVTVKPCVEKPTAVEKYLSNIADHLEVIAEELQEITERIG